MSEDARSRASAIYRALQAAAKGRSVGLAPTASIQKATLILQEAGIETEYFTLADARHLQPLEHWPKEDAVLLFAGYLEGVRLIDNLRC